MLIKDNQGEEVIPETMQLIAGRTGQEYNRRKKRKGAFKTQGQGDVAGSRGGEWDLRVTRIGSTL
jgi:hypothetical protein